MSVTIAANNVSITLNSNTRIAASDFTSVANYYRQWFTVNYTPPATNGRITAADFNNLRQAIINGAGSAWALNTFPGTVATNARIWSTTWGAPVANNQTVNVVVSANGEALDFRTMLINAGWNQTLPVIGTVTINPGVVVGTPNTSTWALTIQGSFPAGSGIQLINNGYIVGAGGNGGGQHGAGGNGGGALYVSTGITITNNGIIGGGGGGGAGGYLQYGGGGAGYVAGASGGNGGAAGSLTTGGNGGNGGGGGSIGQSGGGADNFEGGGGGGLGGSGGNSANHAGGSPGVCLVGNQYITWLATGQRYGAINN